MTKRTVHGCQDRTNRKGLPGEDRPGGLSEQGCHDRTRAGTKGKDSQNRTGITKLAELDRQNKRIRTERAELDGRNWTGRTGLTVQDCKDSNAMTGLLEQDYQEKNVRKGLRRQPCWTERRGQPEKAARTGQGEQN
jgi:hypothetical protein